MRAIIVGRTEFVHVLCVFELWLTPLLIPTTACPAHQCTITPRLLHFNNYSAGQLWHRWTCFRVIHVTRYTPKVSSRVFACFQLGLATRSWEEVQRTYACSSAATLRGPVEEENRQQCCGIEPAQPLLTGSPFITNQSACQRSPL